MYYIVRWWNAGRGIETISCPHGLFAVDSCNKMYTPRSKRNIISFSLIGHNYHVSVPNQPLASYNEGLLQLGRSESGVSIIPPTSSTSILEIPYSKIRRFGYQVRMVFWQMHRGLGDPPFVAAKSSETIKLLASC